MCSAVGKGTEKLSGGPEGGGEKRQVLQVGMFKGSSFSAFTDSTGYRNHPWPNAIILQGQGRNAMLGKLKCTLALLQRQRQSKILHKMLKEDTRKQGNIP